MPELHLLNAQTFNYDNSWPSTAISAKIRITISPKDAAVLVYTAATGENGIRFNGPESTQHVPVRDDYNVYVQKVAGCTDFKLEVLGHRDDLSR